MIKSFKSKRLEKYWIKGDARGLPAEHFKRLNLRLAALDNASRPEDMNVPGWRFHRLLGESEGRFSVQVSGNWRLTFAWDQHGPFAINVDYEDYH